jgi:hypothetical protein
MSADNWTTCKRCADAQLVGASAIPPARETLPTTFREDYEIYGADKGVVKVSYSGHCQNCGYGIDFEYERPIT